MVKIWSILLSISLGFSSVQLLSHLRLFVTPWTTALQASLSITNARTSPKFMSIESVIPFNYFILCCPLLHLPSIFPRSGSFPISQFFPSGGQNTGVSVAISILPMNTQDWSPLGWTGWISLQSKRPSTVFFNTIVQKHQFFGTQLSLWCNSHIHTWLLKKTITLIRWNFAGKVMSMIFNMLSRLVITFLPRSKCLLISWLKSPPAVILKQTNKKVCHCFHCFPIYLPWSDGTGCHDLSFLNVEFQANFFTLLFHFHQEAL